MLLRDAHPGYIAWERFEENERQLQRNARSYQAKRRSPPREGPALLQGLATCGVCGRGMTVRYHTRKGRQHPQYVCCREGIETASARCQSMSGAAIDRAVGELLVKLVTPLTLDVALQVQDELAARAAEADRWRAQLVQRAREEADMARQRFMQAHPDNRIVADVLEAEWNAKLRALNEARDELDRSRAAPDQEVDDAQRERILALAGDFPRLWNDPATPHRERKRMARLLIEDVTLTKSTRHAGVRLRGGATRELTWTPDPLVYERCRTKDEIVAEMDRLLEDHTEDEVANILNKRGWTTGHGLPFTRKRVGATRQNRGLKSRRDRLRDRGLLSVRQAAEALDVSDDTLREWHKAGILHAETVSEWGLRMYEIPDTLPTKQPGVRLSQRPKVAKPSQERSNEV